MSQRLWVKLLGAFGLIIVLGVGVTVLLTRQGAATQFSHYMVGGQMFQPERLQADLADYYQQRGGWQGIDTAFAQLVGRAANGGMMGGMMGSAMGIFDSRVALLDASGALLAQAGDWGPAGEIASAGPGWPIRVDRRVVGTLLIEGQPMVATEGEAGNLLSGVTRAVVIAGLLAGLVAFGLAIVLVRQITRPLTALRDASRRIAQGDLAARVPLQSNDELGQVGSAFNRMASALQTQETVRRNLMADIAHELRTPLTAIQGTVEALQDGVFPLTPGSLEPIHEETLLLGRLVEDLRTLAQAEAGRLSLNVDSVDAAELVERLVTGLQPTAQQSGVDLRWRVTSPCPTLRADPQRLGQVLTNLLSNALRHTPAGGEIDVMVEPQEGGILFAVQDSGPGIAAADLPHLFDRFYRGDRSRSRATGGSGLGLTIARQLVEAHGGRIWAESPPPGRERGSVFSVWLPAGTGSIKRKAQSVG